MKSRSFIEQLRQRHRPYITVTLLAAIVLPYKLVYKEYLKCQNCVVLHQFPFGVIG